MVIIQSILGTMQSFFGFPIFPNVTNIFEGNRNYLAFIFPSISSLVQQGTGTFEHFNELGGLLSLTVPIIFGWWFYNKSKTRLAILLISSLGLITTFSRGALLGSIVGISFMLILNSNKKVMNKIVFISAFALIFIAWKYISDYYSMTQNLSIRYDTWTFAWQYASEHPLELIWGYGIYFFHNNILGLQDTITNLHSGQLQILLELGIIGITLFLSSFIATIKKAIKEKHPVSITFVSGIIGFFIHQLFDNSLFSYIATIYFIFIAIVQLSLTNEDIQNLFSKKGTN
ncbi:MAG: O-antigen ligase family protein [Bacteroidota bacterium]|nr:O-antigen ligase family protein [Bacteroidota bacterium]